MKIKHLLLPCAVALASLLAIPSVYAQTTDKSETAKKEIKEPSSELALKLTESSTYARIRKSGTMVMAVRETASPFSYNNGNDQFIGYTIELCENVIKSMREELEIPALKVIYLPVTGPERLEVIEKGYVDMECSSTTNTIKRQETANFSYSVFYSQSMFIGDKGKKLETEDDLKGAKVAVAAGTIQESYLKNLNDKKNYGLVITTYKNPQEAYLAVLSKNADFVTSDDLLLLGLKTSIKDDESRLKFFDFTYMPNTYGIMLPKGDKKFTTIFNRHLKALFDSNKAEQIYSKWFTNPIPPNSAVLNWPIGKTKDLFTNPTSEALLP